MSMVSLKLLCWNMEWMNDLFDEAANFYPDLHRPQYAADTTVIRVNVEL